MYHWLVNPDVVRVRLQESFAAKNRGYAGEITIGGVRSEINEADLMKHVVLVRHNSYLFKGTVEENLRMAKPDATKEEMEAVLGKSIS